MSLKKPLDTYSTYSKTKKNAHPCVKIIVDVCIVALIILI